MFKKWEIVLLLVVVLAAGIIFGSRLSAQPGSESDPAVSLSYLETAVAMAPVTLEGGEEFTLKPGRGIVLLDGNVKLIPPDNDKCWVVDLKTGDVVNDIVEMVVGEYYLPIANNPKSRFKLQAWKNSIVALPGGSGE